MNKILLFIMVMLVSVACGSRIEEVVEEKFDDGSPKMVRYYKMEEDQKILVKETGYYPTGQKRIEGGYLNGKRHGKWFYWYENGNLWSEGNFQEGSRNGVSVNYHDNGNKYVEGVYENDIRIKVWRFYDENGVVLKEIDYNQE